MKIYRLSLEKYADSAFSGEGPRRVGGRWTPKGYPVVYCASSIALATLEILVHVDEDLVPLQRIFEVALPDGISIETIDDLKPDWRKYPAPAGLQRLGKNWLDEGKTALFEIPSVIVPQESNFVINPVHPDADQLEITKGDLLDIDSRLTNSPMKQK